MATAKNTTCKFDECEKKASTRGWCTTHYCRWLKNGDPAIKSLTIPDSVVERFWLKVNKSGECWLWTGGLIPNGYGMFHVPGKPKAYVHRYSYELQNGPIPEGMLVDHICHVRRCVNPAHLRLATPKQNVEYRSGPNSNNVNSGVRGVTRMRDKWQGTVTHHGHPIHVGTFLTVEEAEVAVKAKRAELFDFPEVA